MNASALPGGSALPISVLSLNPAIDMTYEIPHLLEEQKAYAVSTRFDPGGNGINVGRALKRLGTQAQNYCVTGGEIGQLLKRLLHEQLDNADYTEVDGETRINGTLIELSPQQQYEVNGIGPDIPPSQLNELLERFVAHSARGFGVLTGSLQRTLPPTLYADLAQRIREAGGRAVVDSHDEALRHAIDAKPFLIKPNRHELETLLGRTLDSLEKVVDEARQLQRRNIDYVCVSLDREGALLIGPDNSYHASAPDVVVRSSVGAGDSMVAALVAAFAHELTAADALRLGIACAAGTVSQPGTALFTSADVENYLPDISVRRLDI
ncbi:1-phosphofructokinase [hydrothermal vent metagenome]|uniref:1-phosphofructokinase n=1 Tax=hydrothermal vent metagenome TaxID=652676 RepID=A0A3B0ZZN5_9ZZZZ